MCSRVRLLFAGRMTVPFISAKVIASASSGGVGSPFFAAASGFTRLRILSRLLSFDSSILLLLLLFPDITRNRGLQCLQSLAGLLQELPHPLMPPRSLLQRPTHQLRRAPPLVAPLDGLLQLF